MSNIISHDYIRGLIEGEGCFTFCRTKYFKAGQLKYRKVPTFYIAMHERDQELLEKVAETLKLHNKIRAYKASEKSHNKSKMAVLIVRDFPQLKSIIVPLFHKKLFGYKAKQFEMWIQNIKTDPDVPSLFKLIPLLCEKGFYDKEARKAMFAAKHDS